MRVAATRGVVMLALAPSLVAAPAADAVTLSLDPAFGEGGIARVRLRIPIDQADTLPLRPVRQPDGKLLVAAARHEFHGSSQIVLARFTRRGRPDPTFGHRGRERLGERWNFAPSAVHVLPDGRILVLGAAGFAPSLYPWPHQFGLVRLLADGSRDRTFGTNGFVTWNPPWKPDTLNMTTRPGLFVRQGDGRLLAAGEVEELRAGQPGLSVRRTVFVRFDPDGSVDTSFGRAGVVEGPDRSDYFAAWAALPDGRIVALGTRNEGFDTPAWWLHRFTADGALDRGFGQDGSARLGLNLLDSVSKLLPARDGSLLTLGTVDPAHPAGSAAAVRRILPAGQLDARFGTACARSGPRTYSWGGATTPDGGILGTAKGFVRHARIDSFVFRYGSDGCVAERPLRLRAVSVGPPVLQGRRAAMVGAAYNNGLALIRVRR